MRWRYSPRAGDAKALAGGQSLMPMMAFRVAQPALLVDLRNRRACERSRFPPTVCGSAPWCAGATSKMTRGSQLRIRCSKPRSPTWRITRSAIATIGGSIAHADPAAEMPGIAVACEAEMAVAGNSGARTIKATDFFLGALTTALASDEIITEVHLPAWPKERRWGFQEFARRRGDFAMAGAAVFYDLDKANKAVNTHIGVIGVGDKPHRLGAAEAALNGHAIDEATIETAAIAASAAIEPQDDIHASAAYRRALLGTLVERALKSAAA